jgi:hypothetical protein
MQDGTPGLELGEWRLEKVRQRQSRAPLSGSAGRFVTGGTGDKRTL